ncbi:MAG: hypothetical protein R2690_16525 [Acidimicrobiales bacterium]
MRFDPSRIQVTDPCGRIQTSYFVAPVTGCQVSSGGTSSAMPLTEVGLGAGNVLAGATTFSVRHSDGGGTGPTLLASSIVWTYQYTGLSLMLKLSGTHWVL